MTTTTTTMIENIRDVAEWVASEFHETYERLASDHGYETREASARPWADVPAQNRELMIAVVTELLGRAVITSLKSE